MVDIISSTLSKADAIGTLINKFLDPEVDLSPAGIDNHAMGTVFEERSCAGAAAAVPNRAIIVHICHLLIYLEWIKGATVLREVLSWA
jgi:hypothetical protein